MSKYVIDDSTLASIAEAIRGKTGGTDPIAVTDMAAQIASVTGGGSSDEVILEERDVLLALENGMYVDMISAPNPIAVGETYKVVWGDSEGKKEYECTALSIAGTSFGTYGSVAMGNTVLLNGTDNGVPFIIVYNATTARFLIVAIYATESDTYTIAIHKKSSGGGSIEGVVYVTFKNWDGTDLVTKPVFIGNSCMDVVANGTIETPTRESTNTQTFEYSGWSLTAGGAADASALLNVDTDRTVYAAYTASTRYYTVRFFDGETLLHTVYAEYGSTPSYVPTKDGYELTGWEPSIVAVVADADYYAQWEEINIVASGSCGENATYTLTKAGVLTISGTGATNDATSATNATFYNLRSQITSLVVEDGITYIGGYSFWGCEKMTQISLPDSVTELGQLSFQNCKGLTEVVIGDSLIKIGSSAFRACTKLSSVVIGTSVNFIGRLAFESCSVLTSATFKDPNNWTLYKATGGTPTNLSASDMGNPTTAATYISSTYATNYYFQKT